MLFTRLSTRLLTSGGAGPVAIRRGLSEITYKGQNLPFDITNHRLLAIKFTIFFGVPFAVPFILVRYQLKKAAGHYP
ncbi:unnamed protein product [Medioppia subpectinata]|uniref:Cytochrome c oxidase polypeptide VIIc n=1 Tax=Medioppia subpectinata TaxID=1979941 RepID=A0A7R9LVR7_9ACAR|nr:unnamed protein product [Medioppia subpectinata]CAG2122190.1 unnamed protein product [Medioppia subpectinata]